MHISRSVLLHIRYSLLVCVLVHLKYSYIYFNNNDLETTTNIQILAPSYRDQTNTIYCLPDQSLWHLWIDLLEVCIGPTNQQVIHSHLHIVMNKRHQLPTRVRQGQIWTSFEQFLIKFKVLKSHSVKYFLIWCNFWCESNTWEKL